MKILHNPRCRKSREGLQILESSGKDFTIVEYLKEPLTQEELNDVLSKLDMSAIELVRKNEKEWKENFKGKEMTEDEVIAAMADHPKLIERPIVISGDRAVVGRPPENIQQLLD
ncbi:MAG: arsenate reductase (glutaredoxin) [Lutimonas sp.]